MEKRKNINWYPGHMQKALNEIKRVAENIDCFIILCDARAPLSSLNLVLDEIYPSKARFYVYTKKDLTDLAKLNDFTAKTLRKGFAIDLKNKNEVNVLLKELKKVKSSRQEKYLRYNMTPPPLRALVIGIPNVGKSTFINALVKKNKAKAENRPGLTRAQQLIKVNENLELIDTPGILQPNYEDKNSLLKLSWLGSLKDQAIDMDTIYETLGEFMLKNYPKNVMDRYGITQEELDNMSNLYLLVAQKRKYLLAQNQFDISRAQEAFIKDFRLGDLGRVFLDD